MLKNKKRERERESNKKTFPPILSDFLPNSFSRKIRKINEPSNDESPKDFSKGNPVHVAIPSISQLFRAFEPFVLYQREIEANKTEFQMYIYSLETFRRKFQILK